MSKVVVLWIIVILELPFLLVITIKFSLSMIAVVECKWILWLVHDVIIIFEHDMVTLTLVDGRAYFSWVMLAILQYLVINIKYSRSLSMFNIYLNNIRLSHILKMCTTVFYLLCFLSIERSNYSEFILEMSFMFLNWFST